jgi:tetratricopeptide (TPR) repeat protein
MAIAKAVCGDCGAALSQGDRFCPQCGANVEEMAARGLRAHPSNVRCGVCGHEADAHANFCESCGSALKGAGRAQQQKQESQKTNARAQHSTKASGKKRFSFEPWQLITGAIVLVLAAFFVYTEVTRDGPTQKLAAPANFTATNAGMLQEIEKLQRTVDADPNDAAALIRLANMLHDVGTQNPMLLNRAISTYTQYLKLKPGDPNARVDMGICYFEMARMDTNNAGLLFSQAVQEMQAAFRSNPTHQPAAFNLGIVNLNMGNLEESNGWFKKAAAIDPNSELGKKAKQMIEQHSFQASPN